VPSAIFAAAMSATRSLIAATVEFVDDRRVRRLGQLLFQRHEWRR